MKYTIEIPDELLEIFKRNKTNPQQALKAYFIDFVLVEARNEMIKQIVDDAKENIDEKLKTYKNMIIVKKEQ